MPLIINISENSKKIVLPFKNQLTVDQVLKEILKRSSLPLENQYQLELNSNVLDLEKTLDSLNIVDGTELFLNNCTNSITTTTTTTTTTTSGDKDDSNVIKQLDIFVIDLSGSMGGPYSTDLNRIEFAQILFQTFIDKLVQKKLPVAVGLVLFGTDFELTFPITRNFDSFSDELGRIENNKGGTNFYLALEFAGKSMMDFLKSNKDMNILPKDQLSLRLVSLTDGEDGSEDVTKYHVFKSLQENGIIVDAIPIGDNTCNYIQTLSKFCSATGGSMFLPDSISHGLELLENEALLYLPARDNFKPYSKSILSMSDLFNQTVIATQTLDVKSTLPSVKCSSLVDMSNISNNNNSSKPITSSNKTRILREIKSINDYLDGISPPPFKMFFCDTDITIWKVLLKGPEDSHYKSGHWILSIQLPNNYPFGKPDIRFQSKIYHANISQSGEICIKSLTDYQVKSSIQSILLDIIDLLKNPDSQNPLDVVKGQLLKDNPESYWKLVETHTNQFANTPVDELLASHNLS